MIVSIAAAHESGSGTKVLVSAGTTRGIFDVTLTVSPGRTPYFRILMQSNCGALMLDEIGDMGLDMQATLLRGLEERTVPPIGSSARSFRPRDSNVVSRGVRRRQRLTARFLILQTQ